MAGKSLSAPTGHMDRRVGRTRAALQQALAQLIPEKRYEEITVDDICGKANVGRSTFYAHYRGKEDLQRAAIGDHLGKMLAERRSAAPAASPTLIALEHVREFWRLHRGPLGGRGRTVGMEALRSSLMEMLRREMKTDPGETAFERELRARYLLGAFMEVLVWWLDRGAGESPEEVERLFRELNRRGAERC